LGTTKISVDELEKVLSQTTAQPQTTKKDPKRKWVDAMMRSAKQYHKICPYYDKRTGNCFIKLLYTEKNARCDREGRFDGCPVLIEHLERIYDKLKERGERLPMDFRDIPFAI